MTMNKLEVQRAQRTKSGLLTEVEVGIIKAELALGEPPRELAQAYCVSVGTIRSIARGDTWAWVKAGRPVATTQAPATTSADDQATYDRLVAQLNSEQRLTNSPKLDSGLVARAKAYGARSVTAEQAQEPVPQVLDELLKDIAECTRADVLVITKMEDELDEWVDGKQQQET